MLDEEICKIKEAEYLKVIYYSYYYFMKLIKIINTQKFHSIKRKQDKQTLISETPKFLLFREHLLYLQVYTNFLPNMIQRRILLLKWKYST